MADSFEVIAHPPEEVVLPEPDMVPELQPELAPETATSDPQWVERLRMTGRVAGVVGRTALKAGLAASGMALALHIPYHAHAEGVPFRIQGSLLSRPGFSADTTAGNWEFPHVDGLPIGVHISPEDVDVLNVAHNASPNPQEYTDKLQKDIEGQIPEIGLVLGGEVVLGALGGLTVEMLGEWAVAHLRNRSRREHELRRFGKQLAATSVVGIALAGYGYATWNSHWMDDSRLTGTLASAQAFPSELAQYYNQQGKGYAVSQAVVGIQQVQERLQENIDRNVPPTAFNIMYVADMHLGPFYPLVAQYAKALNVNLIVNSGDEAEFGTAAEMTPEYINSIKELTKIAPMLWIPGNHDSPTTVDIMRSIPGVIVLGTKTLERNDGQTTVKVQAGEIDAYGLKIGAVPDPRVYGGPGVYGAADGKETDPLEKAAVDSSLEGLSKSGEQFDIFDVHEPVAVGYLNQVLPGKIRQTVSGHLHAQNANKDLQPKSQINIVEGSAGEGGLDHIESNGNSPTPFELSVESVSEDCQSTKIVRIQQTTTGVPGPTDIPQLGDNTVMNTYYFKPQEIADGRTCSVDQGIGKPKIIIPGTGQNPATVQAAGKRVK